MKRLAARHQHWSGFLLLSENDDLVVQEEHASRGRYKLDGEVLTIVWDRFGPDKFVKIGGEWIDEKLLDKAVSIEDLNIVRAFGKAYLANKIQLSVPEAGTDVELRLNTSDLPTFWQVFSNLEYDIPELPEIGFHHS